MDFYVGTSKEGVEEYKPFIANFALDSNKEASTKKNLKHVLD